MKDETVVTMEKELVESIKIAEQLRRHADEYDKLTKSVEDTLRILGVSEDRILQLRLKGKLFVENKS